MNFSKLILTTLVLSFTACATPYNRLDLSTIDFPRFAAGQDRIVFSSATYGKLKLIDRCIYFVRSNGIRHALVWGPEAVLEKSNGQLFIRKGADRVPVGTKVVIGDTFGNAHRPYHVIPASYKGDCDASTFYEMTVLPKER